MSNSDQLMQALSALIKETGEMLIEDYYLKLFECLEDLGLSEPAGLVSVPLELWHALVQALADVSGYRVVLQAEILEHLDGEPGSYRSVGHREVASADPTLFVQPAGE
jgi:hypothetical protein